MTVKGGAVRPIAHRPLFSPILGMHSAPHAHLRYEEPAHRAPRTAPLSAPPSATPSLPHPLRDTRYPRCICINNLTWTTRAGAPKAFAHGLLLLAQTVSI